MLLYQLLLNGYAVVTIVTIVLGLVLFGNIDYVYCS